MSTIVLPKDQLEAFYSFLDIAVDHVLEAFDDEGDITAEVVHGVLKNLRRNDKGVAIMSIESLTSLYDSQDKLSALEAAGVDNWIGYDDAMDILKDMKGECE